MDISKWCEFCKMCAVDPVTDPEHVVRICENDKSRNFGNQVCHNNSCKNFVEK